MSETADPDICRDQVRLLLARGAIDQAAQRAILEISALDPPAAAATSSLHFVGLAVRYAAQGNQAAALESFDTALELAARGRDAEDLRPRLYRNVAESLSEAGDHSGAAMCLEAAIRLGAEGAAAWHDLGVARLQGGSPQAALQALERAQKIKPSPATSAEMALARLALDSSPQSARRVLGRLGASRPEAPTVRWEFAAARASELAGDQAVARAGFLRVLERADGELTCAEHALAERFVRRH